jgi:hypothetical protein
MLEFRNIELLQAISGASERSILTVRGSVSQIHDENCKATALSVQNHKDAKTVKALATTSIIFLPASLMAVSISKIFGLDGKHCNANFSDDLQLKFGSS